VHGLHQPKASAAKVALAWILASGVPGIGSAQDADPELPANSYSTGARYGRVWDRQLFGYLDACEQLSNRSRRRVDLCSRFSTGRTELRRDHGAVERVCD